MKFIFIMCQDCRTYKTVNITQEQYEDWLENKSNLPLIQYHFSHLTEDKRELLISNICGPCFDKIFGEEDE